MDRVQLFQGDCLDVLRSLPDCSVDSVVIDPPAGIGFMGKSWDKDKGGRDQWIAWLTERMRGALRVLKPGGHALIWALPRTAHWTAMAVEDAGFEIRDKITHLFGQGFPKSLDVSKAIDKAAGAEREILSPGRRHASRAFGDGHGDSTYGTFAGGVPPETAPATDEARRWEGWGTALKPAAEDWILARKPLASTVAQNVVEYGTGALNIDACRIPTTESLIATPVRHTDNTVYGKGLGLGRQTEPPGRWPANVVLDEESGQMLDAQSGNRPGMSGGGKHRPDAKPGMFGKVDCAHTARADSGGASRFFYCAKASKSDRGADNKHPTVKNTQLMRYLCRLITPPNGVVLDFFMGSGSTGVAAIAEGFRFIGIELEEESFVTAKRRIALSYAEAA